MTSSACFSTDMVESRFRNDLLRAAMEPLYEIVMDPDEHKYELSGSANLRTFGLITMGTTTFNTQNYARTPRVIAQGGLDLYVVQLLTGGDLVGDFNGKDVIARRGDILIIDLARTLVSRAFQGSRTTVFIRRTDLEAITGGRDLHGFVLPRISPLTRLAFSYIQELNSVASELDPDEAVAAQKVMLSLIGNGISGQKDELTEQLPVNLPMRNRILVFIDNNLHDPLLGVQMIVKNFHVSRSHLYRAFENYGGVAKIIRDKRLDRAFRLLTEVRNRVVSSKEVTYRCGFHDPVQFAIAFKSRFGMSPRDVRASGARLLAAGITEFSFPEHLTKELVRAGAM
ncbi:helix-turn-helix domain-containing protein [Brucella intermedia]|uniref:helix-turn-helix domain-containing protein n=1 Tax=Brucella intermedia TaxID=94625 RepID=UPI00124DB0EA|nr:helix-turn-helix domain-containing protein [Brucella intermedia]KAB2729282.1 helix-turn-helix domain-containing protein [Brucella intermedia]